MVDLMVNTLPVLACQYTIPEEISGVVRVIVNVIKIAVPILLIVWGMFDLARAVMQGKEDEIKKNQGTFVKRLIAAAIVFFVVAVVQLLVNLLSSVGGDTSEGATSAWDCVCPFVKNPADCK